MGCSGSKSIPPAASDGGEPSPHSEPAEGSTNETDVDCSTPVAPEPAALPAPAPAPPPSKPTEITKAGITKASDLGPDWRGPVRDKKTGREYYFNKVTNETKYANDGLWDKPGWAKGQANLKSTGQGEKLKDGNLAAPITKIREDKDTMKKISGQSK